MKYLQLDEQNERLILVLIGLNQEKSWRVNGGEKKFAWVLYR